MLSYCLKRILQTVLVVWGVVTLIFFLVRLSGDPITHFITKDTPTEQIEFIRELLGFDDPLYVQYFRFLGQAAVGNFGESFRYRRPAMSLVAMRIPASLLLTSTSISLALLIAIPLGTMAAVRKGSFYDALCMGLALLGQGMPVFWLGTMLIMFLAVKVKFLPTSGYGDLKHLVLPTVTLTAYLLARTARLTRSGLLEILEQDYIRTARAKGVREGSVVLRHALRNVGVTICTMVGLDAAALIGSSIMVEILFAWPGVSRLLLQATFSRDTPLIQAAAVMMALIVVFLNLAVDLIYSFLDPRIRLSG